MNHKLHYLFEKAKKSSFYLWLLNKVLLKGIPFNNPHRLKITSISDDEIHIRLPYTRKNLNHLKGIHACALAAICEYSCGLQLAQHLRSDQFRLIMKNLKMSYHFQAKSDVLVKFRFTKENSNEILSLLEKDGVIFKEFSVEAYDHKQNHICTAWVNWQIKSWQKVKTKVEHL